MSHPSLSLFPVIQKKKKSLLQSAFSNCYTSQNNYPLIYYLSFAGGSVINHQPANTGDLGEIAGSGGSPGGDGSPLQWEIPWTERSVAESDKTE